LRYTSETEALFLRVTFHLTEGSSYDAAEDNEITFREEERITEIEEVGEGWWQGKNPRGEVGMFPGERMLVCWDMTLVY
jgi:hypothetical protein